jgi:hypothetical protein
VTAFRIAALLVGAVAFFLPAAVSAQPGTVSRTPDAPPVIRDPIPGPFIVGFDPDGNLTNGADGIIANAARSWIGDGLDSYTICYQPGTDERADRNGFDALKIVARRLKAEGAATVLTVSGGRCSPDWSARNAPLPYVYIMGAVRL